VGVTDTDGDWVEDGEADADAVVGLGDADGEALGLVLGVEVALADGDVEGKRDGVAGAEVVSFPRSAAG